MKTVDAGVLSVGYDEYGPAGGWPCILGHGFPYDPHAYAEAAPLLADAGARVVVPYLRGFGQTRFLSPLTPRSGEQAALGADLVALMDALRIERAVLGGYDWGGRAACVVAALQPRRVVALVSGNSYNIQDIAHAMEPAPAEEEVAFWYQYYFHSECGRRGLTKDRRGIARLLCNGLRPGPLATRRSSALRARSTTPISSKWSFTPTGIAMGLSPAILPTRRSRGRSSHSHRSLSPPSRSTATPTA
jgi:pimeloyl-ACP methyl ester carboxylesterase